MKPLIIDQLKRKWWLWMFFCFIHFALGAATGSIWNSGFIFPAAFLLGPNIWLLDLQRGYSRVALTLPYTARQIGQAWWWISVGFATLVLVIFSFLGTTVRFLSEGHGFPFAQWVGYVAANSLLYGSLFWFFSGNLNLPAIDWRKRFQRFVSFGFYLAIITGCFYLLFNMRNDTVKMMAFFVCTLGMTILGWLRAESMIADYGEHRNASQQSKISRGQFKVSNGFGGIPLVFWTAFSGVWSFGILFLIIMNLLDFVIKHQFDWHHLTRSIDNGGGFFPFFSVYIFMFSAFSFSLSYTLRFLRTMPISTARLAATLLCVQILPLLTLCMAFTVLAWKETGVAECVSFLKIELLVIPPASVFIAVSIWNTQGNFIKAVLLAFLIVASMTPAFYQLACMDGRNGLPFWFITIFDAAMVSVVFWSICKIIAQSSSAYRPRQNQFSTRWGWNVGR